MLIIEQNKEEDQVNFHQKPTTYVDHVHLHVADIERSLTYYQDVIGFQVLERNGNIAKLTTDGKTSLVTLEQLNVVEEKTGRTTGLYHFAILLPKRSDLADILYHFADNGVQAGQGDHLVSEAFYLTDPDGNGIEIYIDRDPSEWTWENGEVAMMTDPVDIEGLLATRSNTPWKGLPAGTVMGHVHLHVSELEKTEEFYVKGLGFEVVNRFGKQALFMSTGNYHHHIAVNTWAGVGAPAAPANSVGLKSYSVVLPDETAKEKTISQLKAIGAPVTEENGIIVTKDPSGNTIQLRV